MRANRDGIKGTSAHHIPVPRAMVGSARPQSTEEEPGMAVQVPAVMVVLRHLASQVKEDIFAMDRDPAQRCPTSTFLLPRSLQMRLVVHPLA